ncbi:hypothetical protein G6O67_001447 [Ophiocordyceps sinensis]|uniref:Uncharacterized protein n=2 Tax=Ophiocordyceps sinensis TaxID=72228 RepID=A0A8H4V8Y6_9HYPO|nr:Protein kinase-like domain protein [Ophiocordyceps sinensis CO18]KAF4512284.1 hypothetical protein G6O67_001447 [Ophiocordyceps sinensis]
MGPESLGEYMGKVFTTLVRPVKVTPVPFVRELASFELASFELASFELASFELASFLDNGHPVLRGLFTRATWPAQIAQFRHLLWKQLQHSLDDGITPLAQGGARGVLFRVLLAYGYTFVTEGTVRVFIKCLEHEVAVYERLQPSQGLHVPVFLACSRRRKTMGWATSTPVGASGAEQAI